VAEPYPVLGAVTTSSLLPRDQGTVAHPVPLGCGTASEGSSCSQTKHQHELAPAV